MKIPRLSTDDEKVIKAAHKAIEEYREAVTKGYTPERLLNILERLSMAYVYLGEIEAVYNMDTAEAYFNRLIARAKGVQKKLLAKEKISAINGTIDNDIEGERFMEVTTSHLAERITNLQRGISKIISAIERRLVFLRDERKQL